MILKNCINSNITSNLSVCTQFLKIPQATTPKEFPEIHMKESPATTTLSPHKNVKNFSFLTQKRLLHVLVSIRFKEALQLLATLKACKKFEFYVCNNVEL